MKQFFAIGECMVELAPRSDGSYSIGFAGDTFNTAWYFRQLAGEDAPVNYVSAVGDDDLSIRMTNFMRESGITPKLAVRATRTVGLYLISLHNGERTFSYWRETSAARTLVDDLDDRLDCARGDTVYFSGITLAILNSTDREKLLSMLLAHRRKGVVLVFDPNLRPALWSDTVEMCHWITQAAQCAELVLPSFEDESLHFGDKNITQTANRYRQCGADTVVVKDGPNPVLLANSDAHDCVYPEAAPVVDSTAAGDSFNAGLLAALQSGLPLIEAAEQACEVARQVVAERGALVPLRRTGLS